MLKVKFTYSEHREIPINKSLPVRWSNSMVDYLNQRDHEQPGYYKTDFQINDGDNIIYKGRYDIGGEPGDLIEHIKGTLKGPLKDMLSVDQVQATNKLIDHLEKEL